ncbi:LysE family translocator [Undibacterium sp. RuRC25W]|uniref:LysE family translocator n=1 Tax=Undibacterium sp. RuRC25W TaxID=3413047 RepID=UPI003BF32B7C
MDMSTWLIFLMVSLATTYTPGPGVLLAISNSVSLGTGRAMISSAGNVLGIFVVASTATAGLGLILQTSAYAFLILKLLGAAYLIYLGIRQWNNKTNLFALKNNEGDEVNKPPMTNRQLFLQGLLIATTNPKSILFFTALFPQFMSHTDFSVARFLLLTSTFSVCAVISHLSYIFLAGKAKKWFAEPRRAMMFNKTSGVTFVGLGMSLLALRANAR